LNVASKTMNPEDRHWMRRALALADNGAALGEVPVGAVVVLEDKEIGCGFNAPVRTRDPVAHAEIRALRAAAATVRNYRLPNAVLYCTLEPCAMCAGALIHARIAKLVYGAADTRWGAVKSCLALLDNPHWNHRVCHEGGVLAEECAARLQTFFRARRGQTRQKPSI